MYERPRIKRTTQQAIAPNGDLYLLRPSVDTDVRIPAPTEGDLRLLAAIDGEKTLDELIAQFGAGQVTDCLSQLEAQDLVEDAVDDDRIAPQIFERFDGQLRYFSDVSEGPTPSECQERLGCARVAVLGVGGLGSWVALALSCHGIGEMVLVDFDRIELSNLNRQILYSVADVGRSKAQIAAERLRAYDPGMKVEVREERLGSERAVAEAIEGSDVVVDAVDWPALEIERWVNAACFGAGIPFVAMSHFPPIARMGPFYVPGKTGCYACQEASYRRDYPLYDVVTDQQRAKASPSATLGSACALIGGQLGLDILHFLTGLSTPVTFGASQILNLRTGERKREQVVPEPGCRVCGELQPMASADEAELDAL